MTAEQGEQIAPAPLLIDRVRAAAKRGRTFVAAELAADGNRLDLGIHGTLKTELSVYPNGNLFRKCIVHAAQWAGFVGDDPAWPANGLQFLETGAPHIKQQYRKGFRRQANPIAYLESWDKVIGDQNVPLPPDGSSTVNDLVRFHQDAFASLKMLDWKDQRSWLGPWTFHGAFKIFILHEKRLWKDSALDAVTMPMGGAPGEYSFEAGWDRLSQLGIVPALQSATTFATKMALADQVHSDVHALATLAGSRAVHVNSGIYLLGSS